MQSKEQIEARLLSKYEAAMRRERALAYAFSHQVIYISIRNLHTLISTLKKKKKEKKREMRKM